MSRLAIVVVVLAACSSKKADNKPQDPTACPMPRADGVRERFAVGVVPDYRVNSAIGEAAKCHDEFVPSEVVTIENGRPKLVTAGTFQGHCPGEPGNRDTFEAIKPDKVMIDVTGLAVHDGEGGLGKPVTLDSKVPTSLASVTAQLVDRCGERLSHGISVLLKAKWSAGPNCENVAVLAPWYDESVSPAVPKSESTEMRIAPKGPGTCTISVELLGLRGDVAVTVR